MSIIDDGFLHGSGRRLLRRLAAVAALMVLVRLLLLPASALAAAESAAARPLLPAPIWVYNNWSAYDELSDHVPLTEDLAMRELAEILRLRKLGVRFDYYMMDAFWYDPDGGYRTWRAETWPHGPDRWFAALTANGIKPGLWFSTNTLTHLHPAPSWRSSLDKNGGSMSLSSGGYLADFMDVLQSWYDRGVRMFKFDMADFDAVATREKGTLTAREARLGNLRAFHAALQDFRRRNPDVVLVGFNGLVGDVGSVAAPVLPLNARWLDVFDTFYSGDPRPSDVPEANFWRSVDIYSDHMVRSFEQAGIPLSRIDSTSVMIGDTGTNYHRRTAAWRGSALLMVAHGGWINTIHGDLELLDDDDARWLAKVQALYAPLQRHGVTKSFGAVAGDGGPYGFGSVGADGALYVVVNPSQRVRMIRMPQLTPEQRPNTGGRILFRDAGFEPSLADGRVRLGPGQLALVGFGRYADAAYDLGREADVRIPRHIAPLPASFASVPEPGEEAGGAAVEAVVMPPAAEDLRILLRQRDSHGTAVRSFSGKSMGDYFSIEAWQDGRPLPVDSQYGRVIWSGLSWAAGEIRHDDIAPGEPVRIRLSSREDDPSLRLQGQVFGVRY